MGNSGGWKTWVSNGDKRVFGSFNGGEWMMGVSDDGRLKQIAVENSG